MGDKETLHGFQGNSAIQVITRPHQELIWLQSNEVLCELS